MSWGTTDPAFQEYAAKKDKTSRVFPGFTFGGTHLEGSHLRLHRVKSGIQ